MDIEQVNRLNDEQTNKQNIKITIGLCGIKNQGNNYYYIVCH